MAKKTLATATKETVLDALQAVFDDARAEFAAEQTERLAEANKELARKKEEDLYNFNISKRDREDALRAELAKRTESVTDREVKVKEREVAIGDAEKTITELQTKVDSIPAIAAKAEAIGVSKGSADAQKGFDAEVRLIKAENDADKRISDNKIANLEGTVAAHEVTIASLREELKAANARVQEIATNAVTAAGQSQVTVNTAQGK